MKTQHDTSLIDIFAKISSNPKINNDFFLGSESYNLLDEERSLKQKVSNEKLRQILLSYQVHQKGQPPILNENLNSQNKKVISTNKNIVNSSLTNFKSPHYNLESQLYNKNEASIPYSNSSSLNLKQSSLSFSELSSTSSFDFENDFIPFSNLFSNKQNDFIPLSPDFSNKQNTIKQDKLKVISSLKEICNTKPSSIPAHLEYSLKITKDNFFYQLHEEIIMLLKYMSFTDKELESRICILAKIKVICEYLWPGCKVHWFGSFYTGLSLPNGDLDICIMNAKGHKKDKIQLLAKFIGNNSIAIPSSIELILNARVPIIKFVDSMHLIQLDICFDENSALQTSEFIRTKLEEFPQLKPLIIVNKIFLNQRLLGDTYTGGIGSYLLFTMCLGYLKYIKEQNIFDFFNNSNLGHLLFYFYQFYGHDFNNEVLGICVSNNGSFFPKARKNNWENGGSTLLTVESPHNPRINLGQSVFKYKQIQQAWKNSWMILVSFSKQFKNLVSSNSLLEGILNFNHELFSRQVIEKSSRINNLGVASLLPIPQISNEDMIKAQAYLRDLKQQFKIKKGIKDKKYQENEEINFKFRRYL